MAKYIYTILGFTCLILSLVSISVSQSPDEDLNGSALVVGGTEGTLAPLELLTPQEIGGSEMRIERQIDNGQTNPCKSSPCLNGAICNVDNENRYVTNQSKILPTKVGKNGEKLKNVEIELRKCKCTN